MSEKARQAQAAPVGRVAIACGSCNAVTAFISRDAIERASAFVPQVRGKSAEAAVAVAVERVALLCPQCDFKRESARVLGVAAAKAGYV